MSKFFTYIIQSKLDKSFYIGFTQDLQKRLEFHNSGQSKYTAKKKPWKIVYYEKFEDKAYAIKREKFLKSQRNKVFYLKLIKNFKEP